MHTQIDNQANKFITFQEFTQCVDQYVGKAAQLGDAHRAYTAVLAEVVHQCGSIFLALSHVKYRTRYKDNPYVDHFLKQWVIKIEKRAVFHSLHYGSQIRIALLPGVNHIYLNKR